MGVADLQMIGPAAEHLGIYRAARASGGKSALSAYQQTGSAERGRVPRRRRGRAAKGQASAGQRLGEKRQALVQPVIDTGVVVGELLIAMRNAKLVEPPHEPTGTVQQIELILLAAVDVKCLQPTEVARLGFDHNYTVL